MLIVVLTAACAGYLLGRLRPWNWLAAWAENEVRFHGPWSCGNKHQQFCVIAAFSLTQPRRAWHALWVRRGR